MESGYAADCHHHHLPVNDFLGMQVTQCTGQFRYPKTDRVFGESLSTEMKSQIASHPVEANDRVNCN
jgi:hypothetical protein